MRVGPYRVTAELSGFNTINRTGLELLVGQEAVVNLQMAPSGVQETVTVTGEAPLVEVTQSKIGGNIDSRQMQELPVNGRNWMDLTQLAPGSRANAGTGNAGDDPLASDILSYFVLFMNPLPIDQRLKLLLQNRIFDLHQLRDLLIEHFTKLSDAGRENLLV